MPYDVITAGEAMLRLSVPAGSRLDSAQAFEVDVAGAEANVAVALAQLGRRVTWISRLPANALGRRAASQFGSRGVDVSSVRWEPDGRLGTYYVELNAPPRSVSVVYDRRDSSASRLSPEDVSVPAMSEARVVYLSGVTPALSGSCRDASTRLAEQARSSGALWCMDVNYRAKLWSRHAARACLEPLVEEADLLICTREDAADVFGAKGAPSDIVSLLQASTRARRTVVTLGDEGAVWRDGDRHGSVPAMPATIVDRVGAGDAFAAGVLDGLLDGDLELGVRRGVVLAALALGTHGDQVATDRDELEALLGKKGRSVDR